jgi:uncharacterized protein (DUF488 family)
VRTIYSIGHSNLDVQGFIDLLKKNGVDCLVDIRSIPQSRFCPQFNKTRLEAVLRENGIQYLYEGASLGGRIKDIDCFIDKKLPEKKTDFAKSIDYNVLKTKSWFNEGIRRVIELNAKNTPALMCMEEDPDKCHRSILVGRRLEEEGIRFIHIRSKDEVNK